MSEFGAVAETQRKPADLVPAEIQRLQRAELADVLGDAGDVVVPELEDSQTATVLQTQDLFHGGQPVLSKVQLLQEG